jgi:lipid-binding SYLF domain-containing protein
LITKRQFAIVAAAVFSLGAASVEADEYQDTINVFRKAEESGKFFGKAYGYAVFPTIGKGGIGVGGAYGTGHVYEKGKYIGDVSMTQLSLGFQLGGQGFSQIIFFENAAALNTFTSSGFEFGAEASAVAITAVPAPRRVRAARRPVPASTRTRPRSPAPTTTAW